MVLCYWPSRSNNLWLEHGCPRCALVHEHADLAAVWDGQRWTSTGFASAFRAAWLDQARREGLVADTMTDARIGELTGECGDAGRVYEWAMCVLNPGLTPAEAALLLRSTSVARRPGYGHDDLAPVPYTDVAALRELSDGTIGRWRAYHAALHDALSAEDQELARTTGFDQLHGRMDFAFHDGPDGERTHSRVYSGIYAGYTRRLVEAHEAITGRGVAALTRTDRFTCHGDTFGDLEFDIAIGLHDWLTGHPAWMPAAASTAFGDPADA